jgi:hypothetical protein
MVIIRAVANPSQLRVKVSCLAMVALAMWLGGFGCAVCCATGLTEACCLGERNAVTNSGEPSCCRKAETKCASDFEDAISQPPSPIGCSLLPDHTRSLAPLPRVSSDLPDGVQAINSSFALTAHIRIAPFIEPPLPLNRGGTYLRCCVLLI